MNVVVRINGRGPAWPVLIESQHPFYTPFSAENLSSVSFSVIGSKRNPPKNKLWEVLVDAGHNTVPYILQNGNRIPEAIVLTHAHNDHVLGVDWIVQSFHYKHRKTKKYPLYSTIGVWNDFLRLFPYLKNAIEHTELIPGRKTTVKEAENMEITAFPVYHGKNAKGASMLFFEGDGFHPFIITGDMLCPLLRKKDYHCIGRATVMFIDANNRFPDPFSNHASFVSHVLPSEEYSEKLNEWFRKTKIEQLITPHLYKNSPKEMKEYFDEFLTDWQEIKELPHTILDLNEYLKIPEVYLMHYFGYYDKINYDEELLDSNLLEKWANEIAKEKHMKKVMYKVPRVGDVIHV